MRKIAISLNLFLISISCFSQVTFKKGYLAINSAGNSTIQTLDGGYLFVGNDMLVVKTDSFGDIEWANNYQFSIFNSAFKALQNSDSSYIILCLDPSPSILKLSPSGDTLWAKKYNVYLQAWTISHTYDGGYIFPYDHGIIKIDGDGNILWVRQYDDVYEILWIEETSDSGFIFSGISPDSIIFQRKDIFLTKTDSVGNAMWSKTYYTSLNEWGDCVHETSDGGYIISGWRDSIPNMPGVIAIKTDANGDTLWSSGFNLNGIRNTSIVTVSGDYLIGFNGGILILNSLGDTVRSKNYSISNLTGCQTSDGGFIFCGGGGQMTAIKTDSMGNLNCGELSVHPQIINPGFTVKNHSINSIPVTLTFVPASVQISNAINEYTFCSSVNTHFESIAEANCLLFPNPVYSILNIKIPFKANWISIITPLGQEIFLGSVNNSESISINCEHFPPGIYFLRAETDQGTITTKFIKE